RSPRWAWKHAVGLGTIYSTSTISPRNAEPYAVVLVDLDEGPRLMSNVVGIPAADVRIGTRVRARIIQREGGAVVMFEEGRAWAGMEGHFAVRGPASGSPSPISARSVRTCRRST